MKNKNELKDLLDRLKGEVRDASLNTELSRFAPPSQGRLGGGLVDPSAYGPELREEASPDGFESAPPAADIAAAGQRPDRPERFQVPGRSESQRPERTRGPEGSNVIWSENKETMLFGILASLIAILGGILAGLEYLILAGTVSFMLFALVTGLTLFGYYLNFRRANPEDRSLAERVDHLSRRLEALSVKSLPDRSYSLPGAQGKDRELEQKVEELRTLVRSLAKAVEGETGRDR